MLYSADTRTLTPREVSEYLKVGIRRVYQWIRDGDLPAVALGRTYRIEQADLERFLYEHKTVRRSRLWQKRFDRVMAQSQAAFRRYLAAQGLDPEQLSDEEAERLLQ